MSRTSLHAPFEYQKPLDARSAILVSLFLFFQLGAAAAFPMMVLPPAIRGFSHPSCPKCWEVLRFFFSGCREGEQRRGFGTQDCLPGSTRLLTRLPGLLGTTPPWANDIINDVIGISPDWADSTLGLPSRASHRTLWPRSLSSQTLLPDCH